MLLCVATSKPFNYDRANLIVTFLLLVITAASVICAYITYRHHKCLGKTAVACDLAKFYANEIINQLAIVSAVLENAHIQEKTKELFPYNNLTNFDMDEALALIKLKKMEIDEISNIYFKVDPKIIFIVKLQFSTSIHDRSDIIKTHLRPPVRGEEQINIRKLEDLEIVDGPLMQLEFQAYIIKLLNSLEWFAMNCKYRLADETVLYQSLHQTYLSNIWVLYYYICYNNISNTDKCYTNIIWLFNRWRSRLIQIEKKAEKKKSKAKRRLEKAEKAINEAKPKVFVGRGV